VFLVSILVNSRQKVDINARPPYHIFSVTCARPQKKRGNAFPPHCTHEYNRKVLQLLWHGSLTKCAAQIRVIIAANKFLCIAHDLLAFYL